MAWHTITRTCGHDERIQIYGTNSHGERDRKAEWEATRECRPCHDARIAAERQEASEQATAAATEAGLPALTGSDRQVAWAETLRADRLRQIDTMIATETDRLARIDAEGRPADLIDRQRQGLDIIARLRDLAVSKTDAKWWIDYRSQRIGALARLHGLTVLDQGGAHQSIPAGRV